MPKSKNYIFYVDGMHCANCSGTIEQFLKKQFSDRLIHFHADVTTADPKKTTVILKVDEDTRTDKEIWLEIKENIEEVGFTCREHDYQPDKKAKLPCKRSIQSSYKKYSIKAKK